MLDLTDKDTQTFPHPAAKSESINKKTYRMFIHNISAFLTHFMNALARWMSQIDALKCNPYERLCCGRIFNFTAFSLCEYMNTMIDSATMTAE